MDEKKKVVIPHKIHKGKIVKTHTKPDEKHWIESQARLMKILEASGIKQENCGLMLPRNQDRE